MANEYNPDFVKDILAADKEPARTTVWCMTCEDWLFHDEPHCQNIDCPYRDDVGQTSLRCDT